MVPSCCITWIRVVDLSSFHCFLRYAPPHSCPRHLSSHVRACMGPGLAEAPHGLFNKGFSVATCLWHFLDMKTGWGSSSAWHNGTKWLVYVEVLPLDCICNYELKTTEYHVHSRSYTSEHKNPTPGVKLPSSGVLV